MKLIVGLGNPGSAYQGTRHNIGFDVLRLLAKKHSLGFKKDKYSPGLSAIGRIGDEEVILLMPLTFMNLSGSAVGVLVKKYKINFEDLLVVCDDLDLDLGRTKIRPGGTSAGHKGIQSIIDKLESREFVRLRLGIGRGNASSVSDYVLEKFSRHEVPEKQEMLIRAVSCIEAWIDEGVGKSMNMFNRKSEKKEELNNE